ncbi:sigma factor-like helix-turn-helix DNA-binding protein [Actinacidiphila yeochonensis]|uniref:sigma factor-like helix-turn-helix DNA-binding protein n=1 Tax=Actinacidiphila yeochonensis TaxID=89050 RepID=UPI00068F28DB|nr:sigma factor-like helix-turn-helix DNA-binding protein [Actinacidiphila yeochonensis]
MPDDGTAAAAAAVAAGAPTRARRDAAEPSEKKPSEKEPAKKERPEREPSKKEPPDPCTPEQAFDDLFREAAGALVRQAELLCGDPARARHAVLAAYDQAWQHWPEVARDSDPVGWVRAAAHDRALTSWQRRLSGWAPHGVRSPRTPSAEPLAAALLALPPVRRRAVLLHDGLGLDLAAVATETEASERAAAARVEAGRKALAGAEAEERARAEPAEARTEPVLEKPVPEKRFPKKQTGDEPSRDEPDGKRPAAARTEPAREGDVPSRLRALLDAEPVPEPPAAPGSVRGASERGARRRTVAAYALAAVVAVTTAAFALVAPSSGPVPARQPVRATVPAGAGQHSGAGPSPSGERTRAATAR